MRSQTSRMKTSISTVQNGGEFTSVLNSKNSPEASAMDVCSTRSEVVKRRHLSRLPMLRSVISSRMEIGFCLGSSAATRQSLAQVLCLTTSSPLAGGVFWVSTTFPKTSLEQSLIQSLIQVSAATTWRKTAPLSTGECKSRKS